MEPSPAARDWQRALDDCYFGRCELVLEDFVRAIRHEPRTRALLRWATAGGAINTPLGAWLATTPHIGAGIGLFALGLICFAAHSAPDHAASRWFQNTPPAARALRYTVNARALVIVSDVSQQAYPWRSLEAYHETPDALLVWVTSKSFLILPKRAFDAHDLPRITAHLERELAAPAELPRFWPWLLAGAALVIGLLWAWNHFVPR